MATATVLSASDLPLRELSLYHAADPYLSSFFIFYGPVATANATVSSSRIQAHIFSPAGFQSFPRITISPAAPLYAAVSHLPREKQGDEICRGLAVSLLKLFAELPEPVKNGLTTIAQSSKQSARLPKMFDEMHAADLADRMTRVENSSDIIRDLEDAYRERRVPWVDVDIVLPPGSIEEPRVPEDNDDEEVALSDTDASADCYGKYSSFMKLLGDPVFLPTSKLRRAPSQPTNLSKSRVFSTAQKEALRLAMCEMVDTEERYVSKMYDLVHNVVEEFRQKAKDKATTSTSPDDIALTDLFPACMNEILDTNSGFLDAMRTVLDETEKEAMADLEGDTNLDSSASSRSSACRGKDSMGAVVFAKTLQEWFPRFSRPYADYMKAHTGFSRVLNKFLKDYYSSFSKRVYETGEQKLRSLLMEPVQRLPRYSLLIDTMTGALPAVHPAVRPLLKARDIITDICSLDSPAPNDNSRALERLQTLVAEWPSSLLPTGRLITAVDYFELSPPYHLEPPTAKPSDGILLLYRDYVILVSKASGCMLTARGLFAEVDKPSANDRDNAHLATELTFSHAMPLGAVRCSLSACSRIMYLVPPEDFFRNERLGNDVTLQALELAGAYEGKASRLIEEIVKARIEGRFPEAERENGKWTLRSRGGTHGSLGILAPVFEEDTSCPLRPGSSNIRIVFDMPKAARIKALNTSNLEIIASITMPGEDQFRIDIDSAVGTATADTVAGDDFIASFSKRVNALLRPLNQPQNRLLTDSLLLSNFSILRYVASHIYDQVKARGFRPPSPSKLLSSIWGNGQPKAPGTPKSLAPSPMIGDVPRILPPGYNSIKADPIAPKVPAKDASPVRITVVESKSQGEPDISLQLLEQTFATYTIALRSRGGNIVGRTLRNRENADETMVNELYNVLLEDPSKIQAAAEVPVDVLFVAFESLMERAWKEQIGPLITAPSLKLIQNKFDIMFPGDFEDFFRRFLSEMAPQNSRALKALISLLGDLLNASGNDGDRGALTAVFAKLLTEEGDPMESITLLDRLVEDFDKLFDDATPFENPLEGTLVNDPSCTPSRAHSSNTGSLSSNASSIRRRFGFGGSRERSKTETESKVSSIIRTLSKSKGSGDSDQSTLSKIALLRSNSIDAGLRPPSRPGLAGLYSGSTSEEYLHRPPSSSTNSSTLDVIGETVHATPVRQRRKRRSSLSDLQLGTRLNGDSTSTTPTQSQRPTTPSASSQLNRSQSSVSSIPTPSRPPKTPESKPSTPPGQLGSPIALGTPARRGTVSQKENAPSTPRITLTELAVNTVSDEAPTPHTGTKKRVDASTAIPHARGFHVRERSSVSSTPGRRPNSLYGTPHKTPKLRMQSPQKLRERLQNEKRALAFAESSLQNELALIGDEISSLKLSPVKRPATPGHQPKLTPSPESSESTTGLMSRIRLLESRVTTLTSDMTERSTAMEKDLETSLLVSERRAKKLDELYREASAENEALYERFNTELSKVVKNVRLGSGEEALKSQLKEALEEVSRVKKENLRLKREIGGLKAQQLGTLDPRV